MAKVCFDNMSDDRVLERVEVLVRRSNETTADLLAYLAEVDERKLYRREATSSLFTFCVERLHMSESAAAKRIWAARAGRRFPLVLEMVARGEIHLTGVSLLAAHLTEENHAEVLARARHKTRRAIERLIAEIAPRPDSPSRVVMLPRAVIEQPVLVSMQPVGAGMEPALLVVPPAESSQEPRLMAADAATSAPPRPSMIVTLAPRRYEIRVTVDEETHAKLMQLQDLMAPGGASDPAVIVARGIDVLHERLLARKAAITDKPRAGNAPEKRSRFIPAAVRRDVWKRDGGRCAFVDDKGRRCSATRFVEFHHLDNWARGAAHTVERIELRCRAHNQYQAELDYGAKFMRSRREECSPARDVSRQYSTEHSPGNTNPASTAARVRSANIAAPAASARPLRRRGVRQGSEPRVCGSIPCAWHGTRMASVHADSERCPLHAVPPDRVRPP